MRRWDELTTEDAAALAPDTVAILPVASIEQHGPHLPLSVDADINRAVLDRALELLPASLPALALPGFVYGHAPEHMGFKGTLSLSAETLRRAWTEIAEGVHRAGVRRLVLFNSHGGNPPVMEIVAVDLRVRLGMLVVPVGWTRFGRPPGPQGNSDLFGEAERSYGIHAGAEETSLMLHLAPHRVRRDKLRDFPSSAAALAGTARRLRAHGRIGFGWAAQDLNPAGAVGDARAASAEAGAALLEHAARGLAELIQDVHEFPLDRLAPPPHP